MTRRMGTVRSSGIEGVPVPIRVRRASASRGIGLLEVLVAIAILTMAAAATLPRVRAYVHDYRVRGAAYYLRSLLRQVRARAAAESRYIGIVFDEVDGDPVFSVYADGNFNGIRRADIRAGVDREIREPYRLSRTFPGVRYGSAPAGAGDPFFPGLRIGRSKILSFSPLGSSTTGTVFLSNEYGRVYAIVILGSTGRVRIARYVGGRWEAV